MASTDNLVKVSQLQTAMTRVNSELGLTVRSHVVSGNTVNFYGSKDGTGTPLFSFDFPEELYLQQTGTEIVSNFAWSNATYPDSTNPNLDGKTVLVLAVKGDKQTGATVKYSFVDMANVIKAISEGDSSIRVNGYAINVRISAETGNLLKLKSDGLYVGSDDTKADKVANATAGNIATLDANGNLVDSDISFAVDADITTMLDNVFGTVAGGNSGD